MSRQNLIYLVIGQIGSGKTDDMKNIISQLLNNFDKVVILDEFDSDVWQSMETWDHPERISTKIPIIDIEDVARLKKGIVRVVQETDDMEYYLSKLRLLRNAVIVYEDATRTLEPEKKVPTSLLKLLIDVKQKNLELFIVFHSLMDVPSKLARNCRVIILHHTLDEEVPKKLRNPKIVQAFNHLKKHTDDDYKKVVIPININQKKHAQK